MLLLLCGLTAGAYVLNPAMFYHESERGPDPEVVPSVTEQPPAVTETGPVAVPSGEATDETVGGNKEQDTRPEGAEPQGKQPARTGRETARAEKPVSEPQTDPEASFDGKTIYVGNIKVRGDGKVETRDRPVTESGVFPKLPKAPVVGDGLPDPRSLTPAQRRKLQELRRRGLLP